jgi:hypothetical protein
MTSDKRLIAEQFNSQFSKVFCKDNGSETIAKPPLRCKNNCILDPYEVFSESQVEEYLKRLNTSKTVGNDKIHPYVLQKTASSSARALSKIFIKSFESGKLPSDWKEANITPIFKKGCKSDASNYRPVSLTSVPCKLMERMIRDVMMKHLLDNDLLHKGQHGFMPGKSCTTNLLETLDKITESLNDNYLVVMVLLDLAKAFDSVPHNELIEKLKAYGIDGNLIIWLTDFLKGRKQRVVMGDVTTEWVEVLSGVPQGSVLGPLLFAIFINDIPDLLNNLCKLFADDSKLIGVVRSDVDVTKMQSDLDKLVEWSKINKMSFNAKKCKVMTFGKYPPGVTQPIRLTMGDNTNEAHVLEEVTEERDLGVIWQNNLKWSEHVNRSCTMAYMKLGMLRRTFKTWSNTKTFKTLYTTFVRPHLEYAVPVWNSLNKKDIKKIEKVQKTATKMVPQLKHLPYEERLRIIGITSLEERRTRGDLIQMFKIHNRINKVELSSLNTCCKNNYAQICGPAEAVVKRRPSVRIVKEFIKKCTVRETFFTNRLAEMWNNLPDNIVEAKTVNGFKARYDNLISRNSYHNANGVQ